MFCARDDLIAARTKKEHDLAINRFLQRCTDNGFKLNPKEIMTLQEEVDYFSLTHL